MSARVSVVIPCHNYGRFLGEAIESALSQTLAPHEIIVVDDGSADDSLAVARQYENRCVRVIAQSNQGAIAAFNNGVRASTGEYFLILSADDRLDTRYLERTVPILTSRPEAGYVYTAYRMFGARHRVLDAPPFNTRRLLLRPYVTATALMRRAAFDDAGGFSDLMEGGHEDWDFFVTLAQRGWRGVALPEVLFHYRKHTVTSRNTLTFKRWLDVRRRVYLHHRAMYRMPLPAYLGMVIVNQQWLRLRSAPSSLARRLGPRGGRLSPIRVISMAASPACLPRAYAEAPKRPDWTDVAVTPDRAAVIARSSGLSAATTSPPTRNSGGSFAAVLRLATRATYQRGAVYRAGDLPGLCCGVIAASINRAALLYEPCPGQRDTSQHRWANAAYRLLERMVTIRCDMTIVCGREGIRQPPPLVLAALGDRLAEPENAYRLDDTDQKRLNLLYHDLLSLA